MCWFFPNFSCSFLFFFIFVECMFELVRSSAAPALRRRYRLTSVAKAAVIQSLCFPWAACDPHHITDSILHIFFSHRTPPLAHFHPFLLHKGFRHNSSTWSFLSPLSVRCLNFLHFCYYYYFRYVCPSCNIMLWYSVLYRAVVEGRAGLFQVDVLCRAWDLHKLFIIQLEGFPEKTNTCFEVISRPHLKVHTLIF